MRQPPFRTLWASGFIGETSRLHLYMTTPAEMAEVLTILDPFQAVAAHA